MTSRKRLWRIDGKAGVYTLKTRGLSAGDGVLALMAAVDFPGVGRFERRYDVEAAFSKAIELDYVPLEKRIICDGCGEPGAVIVIENDAALCLPCVVAKSGATNAERN